MEILITSKTTKGQNNCVGGLVTSNNQFVRLMNPGNYDQPPNTEFQIGDIWDIEFTKREDINPPHVEDVIIQDKKFVRKITNISDFITRSNVLIYKGSPYSIFDGKLLWTSQGSGYINRNNIPKNSVGFWIPDKDLLLLELDYNKIYYVYPVNCIKLLKLKYVGSQPKIGTIPAGTLTRISLARWWKPKDSEVEERCYLQLSGWYDI